MRRVYGIVAMAIVLTGLTRCMVGPKYVATVPKMDTTYAEPVNADTSALIKWAQLYDDPALVALIRTTLDSNRTLWFAAARVEEARLLAGAIKTNLYPGLNYGLTAGGGSAGTDARINGSGVDGGFFEALGQINWEIDIWGRLRHANRAAMANYLEQEENRNALYVSLVAETANNYFLLRDLDNRLIIAERTLVSRKENTRIISERFAEGWTNEVDKLQAIQQEQTAAAAIPSIQRQIRQVQNALSVLQGHGPAAIQRGRTNAEQTLTPDVIPMGLPSQLIARRPDIRAAERRVESATERTGVAVANRFPMLSLTGVLGFASPELSTMFSGEGGVANGFGSLAGPLFNWGRNRRIADATRERIVQAAADRDQITFQAFADVDNALTYYRTYTDEHAARVAQMDAARKALELSQARYDYGYTSYIEVILMENALFDAELQESATRALQLNSTVALFRALGGGW